MLAHYFLLAEKVPDYISYNDFDKKSMISISDDFIQKYWDHFNSIMVYWNTWGNLQRGLAYYSISILTPDMSKKLFDSIHRISIKDQECCKLLSLLEEGVEKRANIIHFGI